MKKIEGLRNKLENFEKYILLLYTNEFIFSILLELCDRLHLHLNLSNYGFNDYIVPRDLVPNEEKYISLEKARISNKMEALLKLKESINNSETNSLTFRGYDKLFILEKSSSGYIIRSFDIVNNTSELEINLDEENFNESDFETFIELCKPESMKRKKNNY
ncbi:MAG TPA: hypothetical protein PLC53_01480 [Bacilli bacterium]|nr:hypothetical protein [Bacilli bacterium]